MWLLPDRAWEWPGDTVAAADAVDSAREWAGEETEETDDQKDQFMLGAFIGSFFLQKLLTYAHNGCNMKTEKGICPIKRRRNHG